MDKNQLNEKVAELLKSGDRQAFAEMIVEYVNPQHITTDFVSMLLNARSLKPGDSLVKKLRTGLEVRTLVPGSIHMATERTLTDRISYALDGSDVKVTWNEWEMENGEIGTVDEIRNEMFASLKDHWMNKVFTVLSTVWPSLSATNYTNVGGPVTATALEDAIDAINQTTSGVKAVVGTRAAMTPITKFGGFWTDGTNVTEIPSSIEEIKQSGRLGKYYGTQLISIDQIYNNPADNVALLPSDKILVLGENIGEFITFGDVKTKQYSDMRPTPPQWFLELWQQYSLLIWNAQGLHVLGNLS
jgi:hypothetical protein